MPKKKKKKNSGKPVTFGFAGSKNSGPLLLLDLKPSPLKAASVTLSLIAASLLLTDFSEYS